MAIQLNWNEILERLFFLYDVDTQDDLGKKLDVSQDLISKWKRGITRPTWDLIEKVVQEKGVAWDYLLEGRGGPANPNRNAGGIMVEPGPLDGINDEKGDMSDTTIVDALNDHITTLKRQNERLEQRVESLEAEAATLREENTRLLTLSSAKATRQAGSA